jgi:hypothetical protein
VRSKNLVEQWFGPAFARLHPRLQKLHRHDGVLRGPVEVRVAAGGAGRLIGERLRRKLGLPPPGPGHTLEVRISHDDERMLWERRFGEASGLKPLPRDNAAFASRFIPVGHFPDGYWRETSGALELHLEVLLDDDGGWHWRTRRVLLRGVRIPKFLLPRVVAHKRWQRGAYDFAVSVRVPGLGEVVGYAGRLLPVHLDARPDAIVAVQPGVQSHAQPGG